MIKTWTLKATRPDKPIKPKTSPWPLGPNKTISTTHMLPPFSSPFMFFSHYPYQHSSNRERKRFPENKNQENRERKVALEKSMEVSRDQELKGTKMSKVKMRGHNFRLVEHPSRGIEREIERDRGES